MLAQNPRGKKIILPVSFSLITRNLMAEDNSHLLLHSSRRQKSKIKGQQGRAPSGRSGESPSPTSSPHRLQVSSAGGPILQSPPHKASSLLSGLLRIQRCWPPGLQFTRNPPWSHFEVSNWIIAAKVRYPSKMTFWASRWTWSFGATIQLTTLSNSAIFLSCGNRKVFK